LRKRRNDFEYVEWILANGFDLNNNNLLEQMRLLAIYYRDELDLKPKQREQQLIKFCEEHIPGFRYEIYYSLIDKAINASRKKENKLIYIPHVDIYSEELKYIDALDVSHYYKKVLFTLLVNIKYNKVVYKLKNDKEPSEELGFQFTDESVRYIKKTAKIPSSIDINADAVHTFVKLGVIKDITLGYIVIPYLQECYEKGEVAIQVSSYDNAGYYYDYHVGDKKIRFCQECDAPFRIKANNQKFCLEHLTRQPSQIVEKICGSCGKVMMIKDRANAKSVCDDCYKDVIKNKKREYARKRRATEKNQNVEKI
jgi:hypothetical protein